MSHDEGRSRTPTVSSVMPSLGDQNHAEDWWSLLSPQERVALWRFYDEDPVSDDASGQASTSGS